EGDRPLVLADLAGRGAVLAAVVLLSVPEERQAQLGDRDRLGNNSCSAFRAAAAAAAAAAVRPGGRRRHRPGRRKGGRGLFLLLPGGAAGFLRRARPPAPGDPLGDDAVVLALDGLGPARLIGGPGAEVEVFPGQGDDALSGRLVSAEGGVVLRSAW